MEDRSVNHLSPETLEYANGLLAAYGYALEALDAHRLYQLKRGREILIDNICCLPKPYLFSTTQGNRLVFVVYALKDPGQGTGTADNVMAYLIQNDSILRWGDDMDEVPIWIPVIRQYSAGVRSSGCM